MTYSFSGPVYNLLPALAIIWMGGCSRGQKYEGKVDFDGITHIWKDNCYGNGQLLSRRFSENPAAVHHLKF